MAYLRKNKRSPFWMLRSRDLDTGAWREKSTGLRVDNDSDTRKAQRMAEKASVDEKRVSGTRTSPAFIHWVPEYLENHYATKSPETRRRMQIAWQALKLFLSSQSIIYPRQIRYPHGQQYIDWRRKHEVHGRHTAHNTALLEIKFLSQLMNEAVRREYAEANPIARLGIGKAFQKPKPELSDADISALNSALKNEPEWMQVAFALSLYTGCRFSETSIPMENVDLRNKTIRLCDAKRAQGDTRKFFTVPMDNNLVPILKRIQERGDEFTIDANRFRNWQINRVFKKTCNATFHSLRVTFITRCHRGGLSEQDAMRLVNHSSQLVHRVYSRLNADDVRQARAKIQLPSLD